MAAAAARRFRITEKLARAASPPLAITAPDTDSAIAAVEDELEHGEDVLVAVE